MVTEPATKPCGTKADALSAQELSGVSARTDAPSESQSIAAIATFAALNALPSIMAKTSKKPPWKKRNPRKKAQRSSRKLTGAQKTAAKARAKRAGRRYPNLVDNMAVARKRKGGGAKTAARRGRR